ncbi:MAG: peptidoglycan-associated lipoprotein [Gallionellales bacterium RIFCSPHIGHO2_02_FULL_57_16]|nr:MAG: peptidoglycan-associated lipoprotein [Gallionellales bacterium RIFCSPHIGHO2_02_FULL_57_16]
MKKIAIVSVLLLLAACSSTPKIDSSPISQPSKANSSPATNTSISSADIEAKRLADEANKLKSEMHELQRQSIYFDFDRYVVKPEYRNVTQQQAEFIKAHKNDKVTVEGNADERGSPEYNLALGDKRANTVRKNLELLGIPGDQIKTVSFGEEKPRLSCHEEKCWQENRRADFVHKLN